MKNNILSICLACAPLTVAAQTQDIVDGHILPRFATLAETGAALSEAAVADCAATSAPLRDAYNTAFDAWVAVSHLRFGPTEVDDRAFAMAFWPDSRGSTPKALGVLIQDEDPIADDAEAYADMSVAARGFYAMEFLLYDETISTAGDDTYRCQLTQTVAADIAQVTEAIYTDWQADYAAKLTSPSDVYRTETEALQEMFKALSTGLQFTSESRLGRPLGTFDAPKPRRAEAWRSGRSARNVALSLISLRDLADRLVAGDETLLAAFDTALGRLEALDDPIFAGVAEPQNRFKIEVIQQAVNDIRGIAAQDLGPKLGVAAGFNALDGD